MSNTMTFTIHVLAPTAESMGLHKARVMSDDDPQAGIAGICVAEAYGRGVERAAAYGLQKLAKTMLECYEPDFSEDL